MILKRLLVFAALGTWCGALLALRLARAETYAMAFLVWNLFLAAVPFAAALLLEWLDRIHRGAAIQWLAFATWLLFLPNAPYIVTDFIHLQPRPPIPVWYDILVLMSFAGTGLLLGYGSVMIVHRIVTSRFGRATGWTVAVAALILSAFGIYLGRFLRWNSWEVITDPGPLLSDIAERLMNPFTDPKTIAVTVLFGIALTLGYVALHVLAEPARPPVVRSTRDSRSRDSSPH